MIYLAASLFSMAERTFNVNFALSLKGKLHEAVFLPQDKCGNTTDPGDIYQACLKGLKESRLVIALLEGTDTDSGTSFEVGYARALQKPVIGVRTDFRTRGDDGGLNLMLSQGCTRLITTPCSENQNSLEKVSDLIKEAMEDEGLL